jgi:hypothetical protein
MMIKTRNTITLLLPFVLFVACKKEVSNSTSVNSASPITAKSGQTVTITGQNLTDGGTPTATLNKRQLTVENASATSLQLVIPKMAGSGIIKLTVGSRSFDGPQINYEYSATVTTIAGGPTAGSNDGTLSSALFYCPWGIVVDENGDLYVADDYNRLIRKISVAGNSVSSIQFTTNNFFSPYNLAIDTKNHVLYGTDFNEHVIRMGTDGSNQTVIYTGTMPNAGVALGPDGLLYVSNNTLGTIIRMTTDGGNVTPYASGIGTPRNIIFDAAGEMFVAGYNGSTSSAGIFQVMSGATPIFLYADKAFGGWEIARDTYGNFYEADHFNNVLKLIDPSGNVVTLAGNGNAADIDGIGTAASFNGPQGLTIGADGTLYLTTYNYTTGGGNKVRKIVVE